MSDAPAPARERGRITITPPRVTCGECPATLEVEPDDLNVAREAQRAGWGYTMTSGWVCPSCKPKRRLLDDEPMRMNESEGR